MKNVPKKLGKDTIIEALYEIRFNTKTVSVAEILVGPLYQHLRDHSPIVERSPAANIPPDLRKSDPNLTYLPFHNIQIAKGYSLSIGDRSFLISCPRPYPGWHTGFEDFILEMTGVLFGTGLIDVVERFSIKYANIIPSDKPLALNALEVKLLAGQYDLASAITQVRSELMINGFLNIVQLSSKAIHKLVDGTSIAGALLDIDTIKMGPFDNFLNDIPKLLNAAHDIEKQLFVDILTPETLQLLEPTY
jgi:uncharacterized protein (TIGR04255 family)